MYDELNGSVHAGSKVYNELNGSGSAGSEGYNELNGSRYKWSNSVHFRSERDIKSASSVVFHSYNYDIPLPPAPVPHFPTVGLPPYPHTGGSEPQTKQNVTRQTCHRHGRWVVARLAGSRDLPEPARACVLARGPRVFFYDFFLVICDVDHKKKTSDQQTAPMRPCYTHTMHTDVLSLDDSARVLLASVILATTLPEIAADSHPAVLCIVRVVQFWKSGYNPRAFTATPTLAASQETLLRFPLPLLVN
jgi:hypothetical protein